MSDASFIAPDAAGVARAAALLASGELVAFPTETVYGLGADAADPAALARLYQAKGRPRNHPVIVHLAPGSDPLDWVAELPPAAQALIDAFWPGPLTLILKRAAHVSDAATGGQDSIGIRCPSHPVAQQILTAFSALRQGRGGIAAPSANRFGRVSPSTAQHVRDEFGAWLPVVDGGPCEVGIESTIVDLSRGFAAVLRPGRIDAAQIAEVLGRMPDGASTAKLIAATATTATPATTATRSAASALVASTLPSAPRASGTLAAHYAPTTPLRLATLEQIVGAIDAMRSAAPSNDVQTAAAGVPTRIGVVANAAAASRFADQPGVLFMAAPATPHDYAHALYALLRQLDAAGLARILIERLPVTAEWTAVNDRLGRAAAAFDSVE